LRPAGICDEKHGCGEQPGLHTGHGIDPTSEQPPGDGKAGGRYGRGKQQSPD
jgi:hypothetical protein